MPGIDVQLELDGKLQADIQICPKGSKVPIISIHQVNLPISMPSSALKFDITDILSAIGGETIDKIESFEGHISENLHHQNMDTTISIHYIVDVLQLKDNKTLRRLRLRVNSSCDKYDVRLIRTNIFTARIQWIDSKNSKSQNPFQKSHLEFNIHGWQQLYPYCSIPIIVSIIIYCFDSISNVTMIVVVTISAIAMIILYSLKNLSTNIAIRTISSPFRSFFMNGWNAWSYCGAVLQGTRPPVYSMPHALVRAFHDGSSALDINLASSRRLFIDPHWDEFIASDMFAAIKDNLSQSIVVIGFLSQSRQFGYISSTSQYDLIRAVCEWDCVLLKDDFCCSEWLFAETKRLDNDRNNADPLGVYMDMVGAYNNVSEIFQETQDFMQSFNYTPNTCNEIGSESKGGNELSNDENRSSKYSDNNISDKLVNCSLTGWCSWYHYYGGVSESSLISNLKVISDARTKFGLNSSLLSLFQIDDGYPTAWGDWSKVDPKKFPTTSMEDLTRKIHEDNELIPGIWLAPFAADKHSLVAREHPDWILRLPNKNGNYDISSQPVNSANCGKWFYGLDPWNSGVESHIRDTIKTAIGRWGYRYLKLDFLYAAALKGSVLGCEGVTRAETMRHALWTVKDAIKEQSRLGLENKTNDKLETKASMSTLDSRQDISKLSPNPIYILGCGAPLGSTIGLVHGNRVSADAGESWLPGFPLPCWDQWNLPCARSMLRNTITRQSMHRRWWQNDPDCALLRLSTSLTNDEVLGILTVKAWTGGALLISDNLEELPGPRWECFLKVMPPLDTGTPTSQSVAVDLLDNEIPEILRITFADQDFHSIMIACNWGEDRFKSKTFLLSQIGLFLAKDETICDAIGTVGDDITICHCLDFWRQNYKGFGLSRQYLNSKIRFEMLHSLNCCSIPDLSIVENSNRNLEFHVESIPSHSCRVLNFTFTKFSLPNSKQIFTDSHITYIGSNLHISCKSELKYIKSLPLSDPRYPNSQLIDSLVEVKLTSSRSAMTGQSDFERCIWLFVQCTEMSTSLQTYPHKNKESCQFICHRVCDTFYDRDECLSQYIGSIWKVDIQDDVVADDQNEISLLLHM